MKPASTFPRRRLLIATILVFVLAGIGAAILASQWPFTRQSIINTLQQQSARFVEIKSFHQTYFPPGCVAEGVQFLSRLRRDKPPLTTIRKLTIRGSYLGLLSFPKRISEVRAIGLHITVPPKAPDGQRSDLMAMQFGKSVLISQITADGTVLEFRSDKPKGRPFVVQIRQLTLAHVGDEDQLTFHTTLSIFQPPATIRATGAFGPWNQDDPGRTQVSGSYTFTDANLGIFGRLAGTLSSKGNFTGMLNRLQTNGEANLPDLCIDDASHRVPLTTEFHAIVNGTNGDTYLQSVNAHVWKTNAIFTGKVAGTEGETGKTAVLNFSTSHGRIEDLFRMFVRAKQPPISGRVSLRADARVPAGPQPFLKKLEMHGDFGIAGGEFRNPNTQLSIDHLSKSANGESKKEQDDDPETVLSNLTGHVDVHGGIATFTNISFRVPGALAELHGTFGLISKTVDLRGKLTTSGEPADATSGFKSFLLKILTPFLKKRPAVTVLPFKITGTYDHISVGLDLGAKK